MHQTALEAVHCRPICITRIACNRLLSSFFLFSWHNLGLAGRNAQKQVFNHGGTTENLKNALSTPPNQLLQRCNGHSARCSGGSNLKKSLSDPPNGHLISKTTLSDPPNGRLISKTTLSDPLNGRLISKTTLPTRQNTFYIHATRLRTHRNT